VAIPDYFIDIKEFIIFIVFASSFLIQIFFYYGIYCRLIFRKKKELTNNNEPLSVIICARNEAENLDKNLPFILTQEHADYEVIVVNDCSNDNTEFVLLKYQKEYKNLRSTTITEDKKFSHGKKLALTIGIKAAKHENIVLTDADCRPVTNQWLSKISKRFTGNVSIVLGYGRYSKKKGFLNNYIRYDTVWIALQYLSFALIGWPYMGVGRNMAYKKSLFFAKKGFANHYHLLSGDDDLFVNENANKDNTTIEISPESHTESTPKTTFGEWFKQKKRHFTTSKFYKSKHKFLLGIEYLSRFLFYASFTWLIIIWNNPQIVLPVFAFRLLTQILVIKKLLRVLKERNLLISSLFFDIISMFINLSLYISGRFRIKNQQWK
jgi:poly-beta-1,6-N-acetyl-D-glucosamine synthase